MKLFLQSDGDFSTIEGEINNIPFKASLENNKEQSKSFIATVRDEFFLFSFIIISASIVYLDAYYSAFQVNYNILNFSLTHIIYVGLTLIVTSPSIIIPYLLFLIFY